MKRALGDPVKRYLALDSNMTPDQARMARVGLRKSFLEIATLADVATGSILRLEKGQGLRPRTVAAIRTALEQAGARFTESADGWAGVELRVVVPAESAPLEMAQAAE